MRGRRAGLGAAAAVVLLALNMRTVIASLPPLLSQVRHDLGLSAVASSLVLPLRCMNECSPPRADRRKAALSTR